MDFPKFEDLPVTTITAIAYHNSIINREVAFSLLPTIDPVTYGPFKSNVFPHFKESTIISLAYNGEYRGLVRDVDKGFLKNSLEVDISVKDKNINIKLSETKIQMVGLKNMDQGNEVVKYISEHLNNLYNKIKQIQENRELSEKQLEVLKEIFQGEICERPIYKTTSYFFEDESLNGIKKPKKILSERDDLDEIKCSEVTLDFVKEENQDINLNNLTLKKQVNKVFLTKKELVEIFNNKCVLTHKKSFVCLKYEKLLYNIPDREINFEIPEFDENGLMIKPKNSDKELDYKIITKEIYEFARNAISNFIYYSDCILNLEWIFSIENNVYDKPIKIKSLVKAMHNLNYDLGFCLNRFKLCELIDRSKGFCCNYNNATHHTITIFIPYSSKKMDREDELNGVVKKKKRKVTFMCYYSGKVTQTASNERINKYAYNNFISEIRRIRNDIIIYNQRYFHVKFLKEIKDEEKEF